MTLHTPKWVAASFFLFTFALSLSIALPVVYSRDLRELQRARDAERTAATAWAHEVGASTSSAIAAAVSLIGYVKSNITRIAKFDEPLSDRTIFFEPSTFQRVTSSVMRVYPKVEVLGTVPSGVITQSNPAIFPYYIDLANSHDFSEMVSHQMQTGSVGIIVANLWFFGHSTMVGALVPIYNSSDVNAEQFWGFSAGLLRASTFNGSTTANRMNETEIKWCLYCNQLKNGTREIIAGNHCSSESIASAGLTVPLEVDGSCEWFVAVKKETPAEEFTRTNIVIIVVSCFIGALVLNMILDHIYVVSRSASSAVANAPKSHPYFYAIVSICNGERLWIQAQDDAPVIIARFASIVTKVCRAHSSYVSTPVAPHTFVLTSRHLDRLVKACCEIQDEASQVSYTKSARKATCFPFMTLAFMIHECESGFISFDPNFHFDDGVGVELKRGSLRQSGLLSGIFNENKEDGSDGVRTGLCLLGWAPKEESRREGGVFQYGGDDVMYTGALFNRWAVPHSVQLSAVAAAKLPAVLFDALHAHGVEEYSDDMPQIETYVVRREGGKLYRRLSEDDGADSFGSDSSSSEVADEDTEEEEEEAYSHNPRGRLGDRSARSLRGAVMSRSKGSISLALPSTMGLRGDEHSEDDEHANPLSQSSIPTARRSRTSVDGVSSALTQHRRSNLRSQFGSSRIPYGASGTRNEADFTRFISIPRVFEEMLERHYYEHVTMFRVGVEIPFEMVRVRLYLFLKAYELLFSGFLPPERRNVFERLRGSLGVRVDEIHAQLAVRCFMASLRK